MANKLSQKTIDNKDAIVLNNIIDLIKYAGVGAIALIASYAFSVTSSASYALGYATLNCAPNCKSDKYQDISISVGNQLSSLETYSVVILLTIILTVIFEYFIFKKINYKKTIALICLSTIFVIATFKAEAIFANLF